MGNYYDMYDTYYDTEMDTGKELELFEFFGCNLYDIVLECLCLQIEDNYNEFTE